MLTNLPETPPLCNVDSVHNGVYKRRVFITSSWQYSRWEDGLWYEGGVLPAFPEDNADENDHMRAFLHAKKAWRVATFQHTSARWGLANEPKQEPPPVPRRVDNRGPMARARDAWPARRKPGRTT